MVLRALDDDRGGLAHDRLLARDGVMAALALHEPEPVKAEDERQSEVSLELQRHAARHVEVRMRDVVTRSAGAQVLAAVGKLGQVAQQLAVGDESRRAGRKLQYAQARFDLHDRRLSHVVASRVDIDAVPELHQAVRHMRDIDVLSARVDATERGERRRLFADEGNAHGRKLQWFEGRRGRVQPRANGVPLRIAKRTEATAKKATDSTPAAHSSASMRRS